jgi:hypothetical protein
MFQSLMLFLAPAATSAQAVPISPPAVARPAAGRPEGRAASWRFVARVIGDAIGFAALFAGCWFCVALLAALV